MLGEAYVNKALADADDFTEPLQDLVTEYCWGAVWGRDELPRKTRSMLNLAMIPILNRPNELRTHIKGALTNGVTRDEIREIFLQVAIYAGVPAAVDSFRIAREVFAELDRAARLAGDGRHRIHRLGPHGLSHGATPGRRQTPARRLRHPHEASTSRRTRRAAGIVAAKESPIAPKP